MTAVVIFQRLTRDHFNSLLDWSDQIKQSSAEERLKLSNNHTLQSVFNGLKFKEQDCLASHNSCSSFNSTHSLELVKQPHVKVEADVSHLRLFKRKIDN